MKLTKILLPALCLLVSTLLMGQESGFTFKAKIKGVTNGKAVINIPFTSDKITLKDTADIFKGSFSFKGKLKSPVLAYFTILPQKLTFAVFVEKGRIEAKADINIERQK